MVLTAMENYLINVLMAFFTSIGMALAWVVLFVFLSKGSIDKNGYISIISDRKRSDRLNQKSDSLWQLIKMRLR